MTFRVQLDPPGHERVQIAATFSGPVGPKELVMTVTARGADGVEVAPASGLTFSASLERYFTYVNPANPWEPILVRAAYPVRVSQLDIEVCRWPRRAPVESDVLPGLLVIVDDDELVSAVVAERA